MVSQRLKTLKLMRGCKPLEVKNGDNLIDEKTLLFVANSAIGNLSTQSSC